MLRLSNSFCFNCIVKHFFRIRKKRNKTTQRKFFVYVAKFPLASSLRSGWEYIVVALHGEEVAAKDNRISSPPFYIHVAHFLTLCIYDFLIEYGQIIDKKGRKKYKIGSYSQCIYGYLWMHTKFTYIFACILL